MMTHEEIVLETSRLIAKGRQEQGKTPKKILIDPVTGESQVFFDDVIPVVEVVEIPEIQDDDFSDLSD